VIWCKSKRKDLVWVQDMDIVMKISYLFNEYYETQKKEIMNMQISEWGIKLLRFFEKLIWVSLLHKTGKNKLI